MFQYALGRYLALKNGTELILDTTYFEYIPKNRKYFVKREYDLDIFDINAKILEPKNADWLPYYSKKRMHRLKHAAKKFLNLYKCINDYLLLRESRYFAFDKAILKSGKNAYLIGYWQNEKYFKDIEQQIRRDFTFKNTFDENIHQLAREISDTNSVCLNIRRGDFVNHPTHDFVGMEYIARAVDYIRRNTDVQKIYIFSDEIDWCKENLRFDCSHFFVTYNYAGFKFSSYLYLMTKCRHFIIPNSSFGWWAVWLSEHLEKMVIVPKKWLNIQGIDISGIILDGWIAM